MGGSSPGTLWIHEQEAGLSFSPHFSPSTAALSRRLKYEFLSPLERFVADLFVRQAWTDKREGQGARRSRRSPQRLQGELVNGG